MEEILKVESLKKVYSMKGKKEFIAVNDVSFAVNKGEIFGLLGPNGAGKTSTIKCICGLLQYDAGEVLVKGHSMQRSRTKGLNHISAVLEGNRNIYWRMTVEENLEFFAGINGIASGKTKQRRDYLLKQFQLEEQRNVVVNNLSRGMKQKVAIVISLITDKSIILLDEPTLGLDVGMSQDLRQLLRTIAKEEGKTILLSTHDMKVVEETCDRLVIINQGKTVAHDTVENLMKLTNQHNYRIQMKDCIPAEIKQKIKQITVKFNEQKNDSSFTYQITIHNPNDLFEIMNLLKISNVELISLERTNYDLEEVFMNLVKGVEKNEISS